MSNYKISSLFRAVDCPKNQTTKNIPTLNNIMNRNDSLNSKKKRFGAETVCQSKFFNSKDFYIIFV